MPWSDYPSAIKGFSGLVNAAAQAQYGAAAVSELIAQAAREADIRLSFQDYTGIARMYGDYVRGRTAREQISSAQDVVARTGLDQGISSNMVWTPPYGPTPGTEATQPYVLVKAQYSRMGPEGPVTGVFSHVYHLAELHTVGQVLNDIQAQMDAAVGETDLQGAEVGSLLSIERIH